MNKKGLFVVLEGIDGSGKTTQAARVKEALEGNGHKVTALRFPDRTTPSGQIISSYLKREVELNTTALETLFLRNKEEKQAFIAQCFEEGHIILCDRYVLSSLAYGVANGSDRDHLFDMHRGLWLPHLTVYLDLSPTKAATRGAFGSERYENQLFLDNVQANYTSLMQEGSTLTGCKWTSVDAGKTIDEVTLDICDAIKDQVNAYDHLVALGDQMLLS